MAAYQAGGNVGGGELSGEDTQIPGGHFFLIKNSLKAQSLVNVAFFFLQFFLQRKPSLREHYDHIYCLYYGELYILISLLGGFVFALNVLPELALVVRLPDVVRCK
jgi:hypothetical protein